MILVQTVACSISCLIVGVDITVRSIDFNFTLCNSYEADIAFKSDCNSSSELLFYMSRLLCHLILSSFCVSDVDYFNIAVWQPNELWILSLPLNSELRTV